ncbi:MAG TPA: UDP-N-acetylmuramate--L-alanine ligase [Tissierellia bacterium]|nr:UDP-N-acetylmuramate--L-alanine ligase [Tissierellia bacterium]
MKQLLDDHIKIVHLIGIGGISMSALAKILHKNNYQVSGSDFQDGHELRELKKLGLEIFPSHETNQVHGRDLIIYSSAIKDDNPELIEAHRLGIQTMTRGHFLGLLTSQYHDSIAVSGTHGKTTTTSMISVMLKHTSIDPVLLVGAHVPELGSNAVIGDGDVIVNEACEYFSSFLDFDYSIGVILNIDEDHLDYFKDLDHIKDTFVDFANSARLGGTMVVNIDDPNIVSVLDRIDTKIVTYSTQNDADYRAGNITYDQTGLPEFDIIHRGETIMHVHLSIPGVYNVSNTVAAVAAICQVTNDLSGMAEALSGFHGASRRMESKGLFQGAKLIEDYAHHPNEIVSTLGAVREMHPDRRIVVAFQPHTYTRTLKLFDRFVSAFKDCDHVYLTDIYAAREKNIFGISSKDLAEEIDRQTGNAEYVGDMSNLVPMLHESLNENCIFIAMGAGDIYKIFDML